MHLTLATAHALQQLRISFERKVKSDVDMSQKNLNDLLDTMRQGGNGEAFFVNTPRCVSRDICRSRADDGGPCSLCLQKENNQVA